MKKLFILACAAVMTSCAGQGAYAEQVDIGTYCGSFADAVSVMVRARDQGYTLDENERDIRKATRAHSKEQNALLGAARAVYNGPNMANVTPGQARALAQGLCLKTGGLSHD